MLSQQLTGLGQLLFDVIQAAFSLIEARPNL
jgi:hypothetical protein